VPVYSTSKEMDQTNKIIAKKEKQIKENVRRQLRSTRKKCHGTTARRLTLDI
jgi:hypothetical protein